MIRKTIWNRLCILYNLFESYVIFLIKVITTYTLPVVLLWTLYFCVISFDKYKVICGSLLSYVLVKVNITLQQGGELTWKRRYR